ncbi:hypothetical protein F5Y13DRAFT_165717 [Hypoxylon sp. FL1857]|nr:hypothetical protein F5Y13DRAFT_165717 [Hypoxylon sp. FL1857]
MITRVSPRGRAPTFLLRFAFALLCCVVLCRAELCYAMPCYMYAMFQYVQGTYIRICSYHVCCNPGVRRMIYPYPQ